MTKKNMKKQSEPVGSVADDEKVFTDEQVSVEEIGGPKGPDPTRFGDWSVKGRCIDF